MLIRNTEHLFEVQPGGVYPKQIELMPYLARAFETIALAKVATSGPEAIKMGFLRPTDKMTVNRDFLIEDAKKTVLAMNQEALDGFAQEVKDRGVIIVDTSHVKQIPMTKGRVFPFPITDIAQQKFNNPLVANMVALGVLVGATQVVSVEAVERAIETKAPEGTAELNKKAFRVGFETVREAGVNPKEEAAGS